ncbi:MAG TPA: hypothetical protein V6C57_01195 [Coleofasciculaceae cyanobacterium]
MEIGLWCGGAAPQTNFRLSLLKQFVQDGGNGATGGRASVPRQQDAHPTNGRWIEAEVYE